MKITTILAGASALVLMACNAQDGNQSGGDDAAAENAAAPANAVAAAPAPAAPAAGSTELTRDFIVGRWTDSGDCADALDFRADGTLQAPFGDGGRWELNGNRLINVGNPRELTVTVIDADTMDTANPDGATRRVTRCR